jgi:hypothetical protein
MDSAFFGELLYSILEAAPFAVRLFLSDLCAASESRFW